MWCRPGTLGNDEVQLSSACAFCFLDDEDSPETGFSLFAAVSFAALVPFAPDFAVTCLTAAEMAGEPLLGGTGGFEDECRR